MSETAALKPVSPLPERIVLVAPTLVALQVFMSELSRKLVDGGCEVHWLCNTSICRDRGEFERSVITCHHIDMPRGANPRDHRRAAKQLRGLVDRLAPDLVHAHFSAAIFTTALAKRRGWPVTIGTYQGLIHPSQSGLRRVVYRIIERWSASRMDETYVLTPDDDAALCGIQRVHKQRSPGFGADQSKCSPSVYPPETRLAIRRQLGIDEHDIVFIFVGRQTEFKGFPETVRGFMKLSDSTSDLPPCHLIVIGIADQLHSSGLSPTELQVANENPHIHFIGWTDRVAEYLLAADGMVFPSEREGMSVSIMESLSMALPVITTRARGCGDLVRDGENGLIVDKSATDVMLAMKRLATDADLRARLTALARAERHLYDRNLYVQEQFEIYSRALLASRNRSGLEVESGSGEN